MAKVTVRDNSGKEVVTFDAEKDESLGTQAQDNGAPIPFSCGVGACRTCVAKVKKGKEYLDEEAVGPKHITTEDDEILTCICGLREDAPDDAEIDIEAENL
ncbi:(2Fe-2S)-binding protein [Candidatus Gracilibacteria bacterium]|nr:(2Fe-2S)-binding protein [Candidatus Gracilibacteria bacterium]MCF7819648.1 (2Fe-2S)-binding protein [Candidatus Gracilibacteria bacterium]